MIGTWLATTWEGSLVKVALGAALGALASYVATAQVHPLVMALTAAVVPILINALNRQDPRYGLSAAPRLSDVATGEEFEIEGEDYA
jgi:hypothetical protein